MNNAIPLCALGRSRFGSIAWPIFLVVGTSVLSGGGCHKQQPRAAAPVPVKVKVLEPEDIVVSRRFSASVEPLQTTSLAFKLAGTVQSLHRPRA